MLLSASRRLATAAAHLSARSPAVGITASATTSKLGAAFSTTAPAAMGAAKDLVDAAIKENNVVVFSKSYCPYCRRAKSLLDEVKANAKVFELDEMDDGSDIQAYLKDLTGQRTVPNIFIKQQHIGGCSDLQAIPKAEIAKRIAA